MFCKNCGYEIKDNAAFCEKCGANLSEEISIKNEDDKKSKSAKNSKKNKKITFWLILIAVLILLLCILVGIIIWNNVKNGDDTSSTGYSSDDSVNSEPLETDNGTVPNAPNTNYESNINNEPTNNPPSATNPSAKVILKEIKSSGPISYSSFSNFDTSYMYRLYMEDGIDYLNADLFPFEYGNKYGFADKNGNVVIDAIYDKAGRFFEGKAFVEKNSDYIIIDTSGQELLTLPEGYVPKFDEGGSTNVIGATAFKNGKAILFKYFEQKIRMLIINDNMTTEEITLDKSAGYIRSINTPEFAGAITLNNERIQGNSSSIYDHTYRYIYTLYDLRGNVVWQLTIPISKSQESSFNLSRPAVDYFVVKDGYINIINENKKWGLLNLKTGSVEIPCKYDYLSYLSDGLIQIKNYDKWGYININDNEVIKPTYTFAAPFSNSRAFVEIGEDQYAVIDKQGNVVANYIGLGFTTSTTGSYVYDNVTSFNTKNGIAIMNWNDNYSLITPDGTVLLTGNDYSGVCVFDNHVFADEKMYEIIIQ